MAILALLTYPAVGQERLEIESRVSGNQEQPKVLYVLPWQPLAPPGQPDSPLGSALADALDAPERDELLLEIEFHHISASPEIEIDE